MAAGGGSGTMRERAWPWLLAILLFAALVRGVALGREALWGDEALSLVIAQFGWADLFVLPSDPTPGLYYAVQKLWLLTGFEPWVVRLPSYAFGVGLVAAGYWLGRESGGAKAGLWTALFLALSAPLIDYSQEARAYMLLLLLLALMAASLVRALGDRPRFRWWLAGAGFGLAALTTHVVAWLVVGPTMAWALVLGWRAIPERRGAMVLTAIAGTLLILPELHRAYAVSRSGIFDWLDPVTPLGAWQRVASLIGPNPADLHPSMLPHPVFQSIEALALASHLAGLATLAGIAFVLWTIVSARAPQVSSMTGGLLAIFLIVFPAALYLVGMATALFMPRTLLPMAIGAAWGLGLFVTRYRQWLFGMVVALLAMLEWALFGTARAKPPWDEIAAVAAAQDVDRILFCPNWTAAAFLLEERGDALPALGVFSLAGSIEARRAGERIGLDDYAQRVWRHEAGARPARETPPPLSVAPGERVLVIDSGCTGDALAARDALIAPGSMEDVKTFAGGPDYLPVTLRTARTR